jgi:hypothetical protein
MAYCLSGCTRQTASSGETHTFVAGDCLLHEDTSGKGHSHIGRAGSMGIYPPPKLGQLHRRDVPEGLISDMPGVSAMSVLTISRHWMRHVYGYTPEQNCPPSFTGRAMSNTENQSCYAIWSITAAGFQ